MLSCMSRSLPAGPQHPAASIEAHGLPFPTATADGARRACLRAGVALLGGLAGCATRRPASPALQRSVQIAPFSASPADGGLPQGWAPYVLRRDKPPTRYATVRNEGRTVLQAQADSASTGLHCAVDINPAAAPWVQWRWRVDQLIEGASVADDALDDSPARLVFAFGGNVQRLTMRERWFFEQVEFFTGKRLPYATLMYVWDPVLPVGTLVSNPRTARIRYLVAESGRQRLGQWVGYRRHLVDDYLRAFGEAPGHVREVGVLTDTDDLRASCTVLYGDIALLAQ